MSSTSGATVKAPAPWRSAFLEHVMHKMDSPEFVLSTLHSAPTGSPTPYVPHARYCIFRGMWAELPENEHNKAPKNEKVFESELPTFTTDIRMEKVAEMFTSSRGHAEEQQQVQGSGGGGPIEAVWWVKDAMTQWRIKGQAFVLGPDIEGQGEESSGVRTVKAELQKRMRVIQEGKEGNWSWQTEIIGHFGNLSPDMRGTFKRPPPGQPVEKPFDEESYAMGQKVTDLEDEASRHNFRVIVIRPDVVEKLNLSYSTTARRHRYTFRSGEWVVEEMWP